MPVLSPMFYKILIFAAIVAAAYLKGCTDEKARFDEYKGGVEAIGKAQEKITKETNDARKKTTEAVAKKSKDDVDRIKRYYARRLLDQPGGGQLSGAPGSQSRNDGATSQPTACGESPQRDAQLELGCTLDAAKVITWQDWARKQGIPVK